MEEPWSISVKTVGGDSNGDIQPGIFNIVVSPEDDLVSLHNKIEELTGLKACQQRLIYRGRILRGGAPDDSGSCESPKQNPRVKDVVGLGDGQTIHLVPRPEALATEASVTRTEDDYLDDAASTLRNISADNESSSSGSALLAALLGLGTISDHDNADENVSLGQQLQRLRSARIRNRNRRSSHRLTSSDLEVQDPGPMEPVRQGLLTLHTMTQGHQINSSIVSSQCCSRKWFKGQWIDCRDTVNDWLEATIVDIANPNDVLPKQLQTEQSHPNQLTNATVIPTTDPAVNANDMDGRIRLLLEPSDERHGNDEWGGFRQRENNCDVSLLLIHYNGWPHRWDEWIRSDSERIRPFRTRTRHLNSSSTACPTPQSHFDASPPTNIRSNDEAVDRLALLPELYRIVSVVNDLIHKAAGEENTLPPAALSLSEENKHVPWIGVGNTNALIPCDEECTSKPVDSDAKSEESKKTSSEEHNNRAIGSSSTGYKEKAELKRELKCLAPLLDRLGRTLTDAAPHLAAYAASLPDEGDRTINPLNSIGSNESVSAEPGTETLDQQNERPSLFSLFPIPGRRPEATPVQPDDLQTETNEEAVLEPDYVDFINGPVNTTRGEVRNRSSRSNQEDSTGLLGAYLAAASLNSLTNEEDGNESSDNGLQGLGRLIRQRETNGGSGSSGGIDIHIHAIVTGPGVGNGGIGLAVLGEPQAASPRPTPLSSNRRSGIVESQIVPPAPVDEEEQGIFSDLYSENPSPIDLQNGVVPTVENRGDRRNFDSIEQADSTTSDVFSTDRNSMLPDVSNAERQHNSILHESSGSFRRGRNLSRLLRRALSRRGNRSHHTDSNNSS
mmetsp:Transcript_16355/g.24097  ORF Transcript_16355/g.24097 Transcript_16355/m.24097 type:complete len:842 (+) Transcript_16355:162-2687(+)